METESDLYRSFTYKQANMPEFIGKGRVRIIQGHQTCPNVMNSPHKSPQNEVPGNSIDKH